MGKELNNPGNCWLCVHIALTLYCWPLHITLKAPFNALKVVPMLVNAVGKSQTLPRAHVHSPNSNSVAYFPFCVQAAQAPMKQDSVARRCSEHVHFALEFDGLDFCDFLVRDAGSNSRRQQSSSSPVVSSH